MAWVRLGAGNAVVGIFGGPQGASENVVEIADDDPRIAAFHAVVAEKRRQNEGATKHYVDGLLTALEARVAALERRGGPA